MDDELIVAHDVTSPAESMHPDKLQDQISQDLSEGYHKIVFNLSHKSYRKLTIVRCCKLGSRTVATMVVFTVYVQVTLIVSSFKLTQKVPKFHGIFSVKFH